MIRSLGRAAPATTVPRRVIPASFFKRDPLICSRELIGAELVWGDCAGIIVETEAYHAQNDEACHAFFRPSVREFITRNTAGTAYIYLNYGVHWLLNVLVKGEAHGFVLIRALRPTSGLDTMCARRGVTGERQLCSGPGKLTQALAITKADDERNLCVDPEHCFAFGSAPAPDVIADERIGITKSAELPWRFTERGSLFVSRPVKQPR